MLYNRKASWEPKTEAQLIVDLALTWYPWGGVPDEEIFVRFGLTELEFYERVFTALAAERVQIDLKLAHALRRHCEQKLASRIRRRLRRPARGPNCPGATDWRPAPPAPARTAHDGVGGSPDR